MEYLIGMLGAYAVRKAAGLADHIVDEQLAALWQRVRAALAGTGDDHALERFDRNPSDAGAKRELEASLARATEQQPDLRDQMTTWTQMIDSDVMSAWIAAETTIPFADVRRIIQVEEEYQDGVGVTSPPRATPYVFYRPADFGGLTAEDAGDLDRIANDAHRFLGVPADVAREVLDAETRYLELRGVAEGH